MVLIHSSGPLPQFELRYPMYALQPRAAGGESIVSPQRGCAKSQMTASRHASLVAATVGHGSLVLAGWLEEYALHRNISHILVARRSVFNLILAFN